MKKLVSLILFVSVLILSGCTFFLPITLAQISLSDDTPQYNVAPPPDGTTEYSFDVRPGNYTAVGFRAGPDLEISHTADLYADAGMGSSIIDTRMWYRDAIISYDEVGFFVIDGTGLESIEDYYIGYDQLFSGDYHWIEMENGENTGMKFLNVGEPVVGSFGAMEVIDAYQVYLETGKTYNITLDVPASNTFDLYLNDGLSDDDSAIAYSHSDTIGEDENIITSVLVNGFYCIVLTNPDYSSGAYSLSVNLLEDDDPGYVLSYHALNTYAFQVQPGNYMAVGFRAGPDAETSMDAYLYDDVLMSTSLADTTMHYRGSVVSYDEVGFFVINGTELVIEKPYYIEFDQLFSGDYHWIEYENGENTGMKLLNVGEPVIGSFDAMEVIDAYQVYLETGKTYDIKLDVPASNTFDLYLNDGISDDDSAIAYSHSDTIGEDENIITSVLVNGYYCIVLTNPDNSAGAYSLSVNLLEDDDPGYVLCYDNWNAYAFQVQPGNYTVIGFRAGPDAEDWQDADLYDDEAMSILLGDIRMWYRGSTISYDEVGFFIIDGTVLGSVEDYYIKYDQWTGDYHWIEMENGEDTGITPLNVGDQVNGAFTAMEVFDAYLVYLETGKTYNITCDVPTSRTFDLFLNYGNSDDDSAVASSHSDVLGADEFISQTISTSGYYCIVITSPDYSSGDYTLSITLSEDGNGDGDGDGEGGAIPGYTVELMSLTFIISLVSIFIKNRKKFKNK